MNNVFTNIKKILLEDDEPQKKYFTPYQKKLEWTKAGNRRAEVYSEDGKFYKSSRCRHCKRTLRWGDGTYEFDHLDNNSKNNRQNNCFLVCKICHGRATKLERREIKHPIFGHVVGYKMIKRKVSYKKSLKK